MAELRGERQQFSQPLPLTIFFLDLKLNSHSLPPAHL